MKEGHVAQIYFNGKIKEVPINNPIHLSRFEYDYLMAQKDVDTQKWHLSKMIDYGYFKNLKPYFVTETAKNGETWTYILIGVIRDLLCADAFVIDGEDKV